MNNYVTFNNKIIGSTNDNYTPEELGVMFESGVEVFTKIGSKYINLLTGEELSKVIAA